MDLAASMASAVTAAAMHHQLTYKEAAAAVSRVALEQHGLGDKSNVVVPVAEVLAVLPHETIKPIARWCEWFSKEGGEYRSAPRRRFFSADQLIKRCLGVTGPYYHAFMHYAEIPLVVGRRLTVPLMHQGSYRRRLIVVTAPFSFSFFVIIFTTHILKGIPTQIGGFPYWLMAFIAGLGYSAALHFYLLPSKSTSSVLGGDDVRQSLLRAADSAPGSNKTLGESDGHGAVEESGGAEGADSAGHGHGAHGKHRPWYKKLGILIAGPNDQPVPTGIMMWLLLMMSFVMSLFWLLVIATEIVGVAICFGKILSIPDVVMGLTVLAIGYGACVFACQHSRAPHTCARS